MFKNIRIIVISVLLIILLASQSATATSAAMTAAEFIVGESYYYHDNIRAVMDAETRIVAGRAFLPVRYLARSLGIDDIVWDAKDRKVILNKNNDSMTLYIGKPHYDFNGQQYNNDAIPQIFTDNRVYSPARTIAEPFGHDVYWDGPRERVIITKREMSATEVFQYTAGSVFKLEIYDAENNRMKTGSGFVIDPSGIAVTNHHVIAEGDKMVAVFGGHGRVYGDIAVEKIIFSDQDKDLATIKLAGGDFDSIKISSNRFPLSGQKVYAVGCPLGLAISLTDGIVSNGNQYVNGQRYVQVTAPISPGNSGGLLADSFGEAIGVTTSILVEGQSLNLAIPSDLILETAMMSLPHRFADRFYRENEHLLAKHNDSLYFIENQYKEGKRTGKIFKVDQGGNKRLVMGVQDQNISQIKIYQDSLYYIQCFGDNDGLYSVGLDGMGKRRIIGPPVDIMAKISDGWIYYAIKPGGPATHRVRLYSSRDGS